MAKTPETVATADVVSVTQKSKITLTTFNPKVIAATPDEVRRILRGTLIGRAIGVIERKNSDEKLMYGLRGVFEAHVEGEKPVRSGILFMPETFADPLIQILSDKVDEKTGEVIVAAPEAIELSYKVWVIKAKNPQGYEWELEAMIDPAATKAPDPLASMRKLVSADNAASAAKLLK